MTTQLIAVAISADGSVAPHAGRSHQWQVFAVESDQQPLTPELAWTLSLTDAGSLHEWHVRPEPGRHPLHAVDVAIAGSAGEGVTRRLAAHNTQLVTTEEQSSLDAVAKYLEGCLPDNPAEVCLDPAHRAARAAEFADQ